MAGDGQQPSAYGLENQGFRNLKTVHWNLPVPTLLRACSVGGRGPGRQGWAPGRADRRAHGPLAQGQVHRPRRGQRQAGLVGQQRAHGAGQVRRPVRFHDGLRPGARAVRAGHVRRRRRDAPAARARGHRARLACAVREASAHRTARGRAEKLQARIHARFPARLPGRSAIARLPLGHRDRGQFHADRADRRHLLRRRIEEVGVHDPELSAAAQARHGDALLGQCRQGRRHRDLLRALGHGQDHAVGRSRRARSSATTSTAGRKTACSISRAAATPK